MDGLVDRARGAPILVLCTARPDLLSRRTGWGGGKANASSLTLSPLSAEDTSRLVGSLLEQALLPAELARNLLERAEGNPLFAEEYVRMLLERGLLRRDGASWQLVESDLPLPETVQGLIAARLDSLDEEEKAVVQDAAVVGRAFWTGALCAVGERRRWEVEETLHALERREIVRRERRSTVGDETEYAFHHSLVQDVGYAQIPRAERARKHLRVAAWIEGPGVDRSEGRSESLAHHYLAALKLQPEATADGELVARARTVLREAGDGAWAVGAYLAAASYYDSALELWPEGPGRGSLLLRQGRALFTTESVGGRERLLEARDALLAECRPGEAAEAELLIAENAFDAGEAAGALDGLQRAVKLVEHAADDSSKAFVLGWGAWRLASAGLDAEKIVALAEEGVRVSRALESSDLEAQALNGLALAHAGRGDFDRSVSCFEEGLTLARRRSPFNTVRLAGNFASVLHGYGDIARARELHEEGYALALEYGVGFARRWLEAELVLDRWHAGEWQQARAEFDAYFAAELGPYLMDAAIGGTRALTRLAAGDVEGASEDAEWSLRRARESVEDQVICPALAVSARVLLERGRTSEAAERADELVAIIRGGADDLADAWLVELVVVLCALDRAAEVTELVRGLSYETRWVQAAALLARGEHASAAELFAEIGSAPYEAWARLESGETAQVERASAFYRSVGATAYASLCEARISALRDAS